MHADIRGAVESIPARQFSKRFSTFNQRAAEAEKVRLGLTVAHLSSLLDLARLALRHREPGAALSSATLRSRHAAGAVWPRTSIAFSGAGAKLRLASK